MAPEKMEKEKPLIGIVPLIDEKRDSYWMLPGYMKGVEEAGGLSVMLPLTSDEKDISRLKYTCDGFLFAGGHDVSPKLYGETAMAECGYCVEERDRMELSLLRQVLEADKPVLGICRGLQFINVALGGTLYQDLPTQRPTEIEHHQKPPYDQPAHQVDILEKTPLFELLGKGRISVNSCHHQGIKKLAGALKEMACSPDGLVEAAYMPGKSFVWAVQWHPEFSYLVDGDSRKIFHAFVRMCSAD